ncbi:hypothetical protein K491DRAFT_683422 [Lophiostoma macrostomum CBS 122681]|uniref:Uncharacterized protein n=1 Tax=Lophiostoma macrostomum CBS 122681 TaxID=1314788 RepID=A0A6A6SQF4_9PLEO|nr:hypothetical protein K491DRAFT_683422 [Lophiostoma macrostomum CBS 122681]
MPLVKILINTLLSPSTPILSATGLALSALCLRILYYRSSKNTKRALSIKLRNVYCRYYFHENPTVPISVNFHFSRKCNAECGLTSYVAPIEEAKQAMKMLADEGMQKINFAGGERGRLPKQAH